MSDRQHPIDDFLDTGSEEVLDRLSKEELIVVMNDLTGYQRESEGETVPWYEYTSTVQKSELREAVAVLYGSTSE